MQRIGKINQILGAVACGLSRPGGVERLPSAERQDAAGRARLVVPCRIGGLRLEPNLLFQVNYLEWTHAGRIRDASFHGLLATP
jgi:hypothetical protein